MDSSTGFGNPIYCFLTHPILLYWRHTSIDWTHFPVESTIVPLESDTSKEYFVSSSSTF